MDELAELKRRVDSAVEHLAAAQNARRQQQDSLIQLLADLEVKFDARHEELAYCHSRINGLEQTNAQLTELLNTVVDLIENGSVEDPEDPIFRASQMAAELVRLCGSEQAAHPAPGVADAAAAGTVTIEPEPVATGGRASVAGGDAEPAERALRTTPPMGLAASAPAAHSRDASPPAGPDHHFDEVSNDELEVEALLDGAPEDDTLPSALARAMVAADGGGPGDEHYGPQVGGAQPENFESAPRAAPDVIAAPALAEADDEIIDDPGIDTIVDFDAVDLDQRASTGADADRETGAPAGDDADIKVLMARIQQAAEKARSRSDVRDVGSPGGPDASHDKTGTS